MEQSNGEEGQMVTQDADNVFSMNIEEEEREDGNG